jgi:hypothetical protein
VLLAIARCRIADLGGHRDRCSDYGQTTAIAYYSCRNRHCSKCQGNARLRWFQARERELLPSPLSVKRKNELRTAVLRRENAGDRSIKF